MGINRRCSQFVVPRIIRVSLWTVALTTCIATQFQFPANCQEDVPIEERPASHVEADKLVATFGIAKNRKERTAAAAGLIQFDEKDETRLLSSSVNPSVALICDWHRYLRDFKKDVSIEDRRLGMRRISEEFGRAIETQLKITPPKEWLAVISNAHCETDCGFSATEYLLTLRRGVDISNDEKCWPHLQFVDAGRKLKLSTNADCKGAGVDAKIEIPEHLKAEIDKWTETDTTCHWLYGIADESSFYLVLPSHRELDLTIDVYCLSREKQSRGLVKWKSELLSPWGFWVFPHAGRIFAACQMRIDKKFLYVFSCFEYGISIDVLDLNTGETKQSFCHMDSTTIHPESN